MLRAATGDAAPLRVGVVGVGVMGSNHARVIAELPGLALAGIVDIDPEPARMVSGMLGCAAFENLDALLDHGVDAVTIAAPTHCHHDLAIACIRRGVHV